MKKETNRTEIPMLMSAKDIQELGVSRAMAYQILNRNDIPVLKIGDRKMVKRDDFMTWLDLQILNPSVAESCDTDEQHRLVRA